MRYNQDGKPPVSPLMCDFSDTKSSLKMRFANIFEDSKKKKGIISLIIILIIIGLIGSFFVFGKKEVEQTNDSLTIYAMGYKTVEGGARYQDSYTYNVVVDDYKKMYEDVNINLVEFPDISVKAFTDKIVTEILAGKGPDVIIFDENMMKIKDVNKIIASGVLSPMDEFLANDETFKQEDYYQGILKSGMYRGKRYAMPLRFNIPLIASGEKVLNNASIDKDACKKNYSSFIEQCKIYTELNLDNADAAQLFNLHSASFVYELLDYIGGNPTKENKDIDTPEFRSIFETIKMLTKYMPPDNSEYIPTPLLVEQGKVIFSGMTSNPIGTLTYNGAGGITQFDTPVIIPMRKLNGNPDAIITSAAMINSNSANKQNAYNFIKQIMTYKSNSYFMNDGISSRRAYAELVIKDAGLYDQYWENYDYHIPAIDNSLRNEMMAIVKSIDSANFVTPVAEIIKTELQPFLDDKMTYEECIKQAQTKVDLYFAE